MAMYRSRRSADVPRIKQQVVDIIDNGYYNGDGNEANDIPTDDQGDNPIEFVPIEGEYDSEHEQKYQHMPTEEDAVDDHQEDYEEDSIVQRMNPTATVRVRQRIPQRGGYRAAKRRIRRLMTKWSDADTYRLIAEVHKRGNLWNPLHPGYKDKAARDADWWQMVGMFGQDKDEMITKWNNLRVNYRNAWSKRKRRSDRIGATPTHKFYKELNFLEPSLRGDHKDAIADLKMDESSQSIVSLHDDVNNEADRAQCEVTVPSDEEFTEPTAAPLPAIPQRSTMPQLKRRRFLPRPIPQQIPVQQPRLLIRSVHGHTHQSHLRSQQPLKPIPNGHSTDSFGSAVLEKAHDLMTASLLKSRQSDEFDTLGKFIGDNLRNWTRSHPKVADKFRTQAYALVFEFQRQISDLNDVAVPGPEEA